MIKRLLLYSSILPIFLWANDVSYEARSIRDLLEFKSEDYFNTPDHWSPACLNVAPSDDAGASRMAEGVYFDPASQKFVKNGEGAIELNDYFAGSIKIKQLWLSKNLDFIGKEFLYTWHSPSSLVFRSNSSMIDRGYMPFIEGGLIICNLDLSIYNDEGVLQQENFSKVTVIPYQWEVYVGSAFRYLMETKHGFDLFGAQKERKIDLAELALGDNPILSIVAFKRLVELEDLDLRVVEAILNQVKGTRKSVFIAEIIKSIQKPNGAKISEILVDSIHNSNSATQLYRITIGLYVAALQYPIQFQSLSLGLLADGLEKKITQVSVIDPKNKILIDYLLGILRDR